MKHKNVYIKKKTRKPLIALTVLVILAACGIGAYFYASSHSALLATTLTAYDDSCTISVPVSWQASSGASSNAVIAAENSSSSMYAMVSIDRQAVESGSTIEDYIDSYIQKIADSSDDPLVQVTTVEPAMATYGENTGYYFELDSVSDGLTLHLWDFVFTSGGAYVHVDVAAAGDDQADSAKIAQSIISSLHMKNG